MSRALPILKKRPYNLPFIVPDVPSRSQGSPEYISDDVLHNLYGLPCSFHSSPQGSPEFQFEDGSEFFSSTPKQKQKHCDPPSLPIHAGMPFDVDFVFGDPAVRGRAEGSMYILLDEAKEKPESMVFENIDIRNANKPIPRGTYPIDGHIDIDHGTEVALMSLKILPKTVVLKSRFDAHACNLISGTFFFDGSEFNYHFDMKDSCLSVLTDTKYRLEGTLTIEGWSAQTISMYASLVPIIDQ